MSPRPVPVPPEKLSLWRRIALHVWQEPSSPTICATRDYDVENALRYLAEHEARTGNRITITALMIKISALSLARFPELNRRIVGGRLFDLPSIDIAAPVTLGDRGETAMVLIRHAESKSLDEIAQELKGRTRATKETNAKLEQGGELARILDAFPTFLVSGIVRAAKVAIAGSHLDALIPDVDVSPGSFSVSSLGMNEAATFTGLALMPPPGIGIVGSMILGRVEKKPVVENDQIVARHRMPLMAFFDHRAVDGWKITRYGQFWQDVLDDPAAFLDR